MPESSESTEAAAADPAALEYRSVRHQFQGPLGETAALQDFSLRLADAETLCLIGPSGCGKTTALRVANRTLEFGSGQVLFQGRDVFDYDPLELRHQLGYVPQDGQLLPHRTVLDNVALLPRLTGWSVQRQRDRATELLELVNLPAAEFGQRYPRTLSGGQRQRVAIARALALDPPCLLMDEPFSALDTVTRRELGGEFLRMRSLVRKAVLLVTHDLDEAFRLGDRVALMAEGRVVQQGQRQDFVERPADDFTRNFVRDFLVRQ